LTPDELATACAAIDAASACAAAAYRSNSTRATIQVFDASCAVDVGAGDSGSPLSPTINAAAFRLSIQGVQRGIG